MTEENTIRPAVIEDPIMTKEPASLSWYEKVGAIGGGLLGGLFPPEEPEEPAKILGIDKTVFFIGIGLIGLTATVIIVKKLK